MIARTAALCALTLWLLPQPASACSCVRQTLEQAQETSQAIFEGRVLSVGEPAPLDGNTGIGMRRVKLEVVQHWKGIGDVLEVEVITAAQTSACGYDFSAGESYIVYTYPVGDDGSGMGVSACGRTRPRSKAEEDLHLLGAGITTVAVKTAAKEEPKPTAPVQGGCASCSAADRSAQAAGSTALWLLCVVALRRFTRGRAA